MVQQLPQSTSPLPQSCHQTWLNQALHLVALQDRMLQNQFKMNHLARYIVNFGLEN